MNCLFFAARGNWCDRAKLWCTPSLSRSVHLPGGKARSVAIFCYILIYIVITWSSTSEISLNWAYITPINGRKMWCKLPASCPSRAVALFTRRFGYQDISDKHAQVSVQVSSRDKLITLALHNNIAYFSFFNHGQRACRPSASRTSFE